MEKPTWDEVVVELTTYVLEQNNLDEESRSSIEPDMELVADWLQEKGLIE